MSAGPFNDAGPATPDDFSPVVAELIRSTAPAIWDWVFNYDRGALVECMRAWWEADDALWSHRNAHVVRGDGRPIALLLSFTHEQYARALGPTVAIAQRMLTQEAFDHMMWAFGWFRAIVIEIPGDARYVNQVAVVPEQRGKGIGTDLLSEEFSRAKLRGLKAVELDVNAENMRARKLYERLGMYVFSTISAPPLKRYGFETHHRMRIDL